MINRKQIELDRFKEDISKTWQLSVVENSALESFLELFFGGQKY